MNEFPHVPATRGQTTQSSCQGGTHSCQGFHSQMVRTFPKQDHPSASPGGHRGHMRRPYSHDPCYSSAGLPQSPVDALSTPGRYVPSRTLHKLTQDTFIFPSSTSCFSSAKTFLNKCWFLNCRGFSVKQGGADSYHSLKLMLNTILVLCDISYSETDWYTHLLSHLVSLPSNHRGRLVHTDQSSFLSLSRSPPAHGFSSLMGNG